MSSLSLIGNRALRGIAAGGGAACLVLLQSAMSTGAGPQEPPELGIWYDDTGRGAIRISQCGPQLCGHIHWLKSPLNSAGEPLHDVNNPDPDARQRPICGLQIFGKLAPDGNGSWEGGWIYDPKVGKSYDVQIRRLSAEVLEVHGYAGMKLFGKTFTWHKAPDDLPACKLTEEATEPTE